MTAYPKPASGAPNFPELEAGVLGYWDSDDTFRASIAGRDGAPEYVFYDGPPFANGLPHYGHLLTGYVKDIVPRYETMRGKRVERRFGWDTHGLPAELEAMRLNGIKNVLGMVVNAVGSFVFIIVSPELVSWPVALMVGTGALLGGVIGARVGRRLPPDVLRAVIVVIGVVGIVKMVFFP